MTREEAQQLLPVIQAYAEGKTIQVRINNDDTWTDLLDNKLEISKLFEYSIKPEPEYRSFNNKEECWQEMLKHQPFGWIVDKKYQLIYNIYEVGNYHIGVDNTITSFSRAFVEYKFVDGTPFGIKEE